MVDPVRNTSNPEYQVRPLEQQQILHNLKLQIQTSNSSSDISQFINKSRDLIEDYRKGYFLADEHQNKGFLHKLRPQHYSSDERIFINT